MGIRREFRLMFWGTMILSMLPATLAVAQSDAQLLREILQAFKDRETALKTARFKVVQDYSVPAGSLPAHLNQDSSRDPSAPFPGSDQRHVVERELSWDGGNCRATLVSPYLNENLPGKTWTFIETYDGKLRNTMNLSAKLDYGSGGIHEKGQGLIVATALFPLVLNYRIFTNSLSPHDPDGFRVVRRNVPIGELKCVLVEEPPKPGSQSRAEFWLDPGNQYRIVRHQAYVELTQPLSRIDIDYQEVDDPGVRWLPSQWQETRTGHISGSAVTRLVDYELNPAIPAEEFRIDFPVGTIVYDDRLPREDANFVIQKDGTWRLITKAERSSGTVTHDAVMNTPPGEALAYRSRQIWRVILVACLLTGLAVAAYFGSRRRIQIA